MTALRSAHLPLDHVVAETIAFPLATVEAFRQAPYSMSPLLDKDPATCNLWRGAEQNLLVRMPAVSVDELVHLRDALWFGGGQNGRRPPVRLTEYLRRVAAWCLQPAGGRVVPLLPIQIRDRMPDRAIPSVVARRFWRWLSMSLPPDLLISALEPLPPCGSVTTLSRKIEGFLEHEGFAETHLHIGAAIEFPVYWVATLHALGSKDLRSDAMKSPGADMNEGRDLAPWLLRGALVRTLLASFLGRVRDLTAPPYLSFADFLCEALDKPDSHLRTTLGMCNVIHLRRVFRSIVTGASPPAELHSTWAATKNLYSAITGLHERWPRFPRDPDGAALVDPIGSVFPARRADGTSSDTAFCAAALRWMEGEHGSKDLLFARLFWQVVRLRAIYYRHVVQRPMIPGLSWFIRFFGRIKPGRRPLDAGMVARAAKLDGLDHGLRSLEIRTEPADSKPDSIRYIEALAAERWRRPRSALRDRTSLQIIEKLAAELGVSRSGTGGVSPAEMGFVAHFTRDRGGRFREGRPNAGRTSGYEDPAHEWQLRRFADLYRVKRRQAHAMAEMLRTWPLSLLYLRGLDVCTDEQGVPTWVLAPLFRYVRAAGLRASSVLRARRGLDVSGLRTTAHAGEDFVHLLSGLRRIGEALEHLGLGDSDRIGHGLALGIDAGSWARTVGTVAMPLETRLFDLLWAYHFGEHNHIPIDGHRIRYLQGEITRLGRQLFGDLCDGVTLESLQELVQLLYSERALRAHGFPDRVLPRERWSEPACRRLFDLYLTDTCVFSRGQEILHVDPLQEASDIEALQRSLRRKLARRDIAVEINPSSNLFIGDYGHLSNHPLWSMAPYKDDPTVSEERLAVCLGSDNPLTFATTIRDEYQLVYDTLVRLDATEQERDRWIRRAATAGMRNRFTLDAARRHQPRDIELHDEPAVLLPP